MLRICMIVILGILCTNYFYAQDTYIKTFKVTNNNKFEFSTNIELTNEFIFLGVHANCDSSKCLLISKLDNYGSLIWNKGLKSTDSGNFNFIKINNDTLFVSGHEDWNSKNSQLNLYFLDSQSGDSLFNNYFNYNSIASGLGFANMGLELFDYKILLYGEYTNKNNILDGLIQWTDKQGKPIRTTTYQIPNNKTINALQDLQSDGYGNLVFATVFVDEKFKESIVIRKLNNVGKVTKDVIIPSNTSLNPRPQFAVNKEKQYIFSHTNWAPGSVQQLVCTDTIGNIFWTHNYPLKNFGQATNKSHNYDIKQITPTTDGGVIITAKIRSNENQIGFYDDAYIGKFDKYGTLEWERRINFLDNRDSLYDWCALYDIKERPDGKGYIAVGSHSPSDTSTTNILLVSIDRDGCIEGLDCDGDRIVVSTSNEIEKESMDNSLFVFPNPSNGIFKINVYDDELINMFVKIRDINGKIVHYEKTSSEYLDLSHLGEGLYIAEIVIRGKSYFRKIVILK